ncbi:mycothiol synthase [Corynebacterium rouxii]|uniref:Mycothiol acetyltransferase n=1 Tax=Corynebacterium rouxii TaxID=2719119 RepID=A0ABU3PPF2_9CORY|nr:mycothiol synthase [Corynebacterium rouxii]MDT9409464.1 mycothiol synthase [Corynebacterium rouxii]MDT9411697.1 mycothiol synthase [Corynebacterium rouxii]
MKMIETSLATTSVALRDRVDEIIVAATRADGIAPLSESFLNGLRREDDGHVHYCVTDSDGLVVGIAAQDAESAEVVVHPECRRQGYGSFLIRHLMSKGVKNVWAHGDGSGARAVAKALHLVQSRQLLVMAVEGEQLAESAQLQVPNGFRVLALNEAYESIPDIEQQWLRVNNEAFEWHPEQGGWDSARLAKTRDASWFRESDVLFLIDTAKRTVAGFHWTKRHGDLEEGADGEVYVVGLGSAYRRRGLGDLLIRMGLHHLEYEKARRVILYVEGDNQSARRAYDALGFHVTESHVTYSPQPSL